jgi:transcriptional antiterminator NusG
MTEVQEKKWYVIRAISGQENKIKTYIESEVKRLKLTLLLKKLLFQLKR